MRRRPLATYKRLREINHRVKNNMYYDQVARTDIDLLLGMVTSQTMRETLLIQDLIRARLTLEDLPLPPWKLKEE